MLEDAEKFATADQEKRKNIDLKNQAETLCFEAEKELELFKANISEDKQESIKKLIENIRQDVQADNVDSLNLLVEELKVAMKDMVDANAGNDAADQSMSDLNDL